MHEAPRREMSTMPSCWSPVGKRYYAAADASWSSWSNQARMMCGTEQDLCLCGLPRSGLLTERLLLQVCIFFFSCPKLPSPLGWWKKRENEMIILSDPHPSHAMAEVELPPPWPEEAPEATSEPADVAFRARNYDQVGHGPLVHARPLGLARRKTAEGRESGLGWAPREPTLQGTDDATVRTVRRGAEINKTRIASRVATVPFQVFILFDL